MRLQQQWWSVLVAAVLGGLVGVTAVAAAGEQFLPVLGVREGALRSLQIPMANGFIDYVTLLNERDGGINGVHLGLGRVRNRLRRPPRRRVLRAPESQGAHGGGGVSAGQHPARLCPDGAGHARPDPPARVGVGRSDASDGRVFPYVFNRPDQLVESEHGQDPVHRPTGRRHGRSSRAGKSSMSTSMTTMAGKPSPSSTPGRPVRLYGAAPGGATAGARPEGDLAAGQGRPARLGHPAQPPAS